MKILAIDPGPEQSGFVCLETVDDQTVHPVIVTCDTLPNDEVLAGIVIPGGYRILVMEMIETWGMAVGKSVFETLYWMGRFHEAAYPHVVERLTRKNIMLALTGSRKARPQEVKTAILDRFGPGKERAIGNKRHPGPLYHVKGHQWAALAVGLAHQLHAAVYSYQKPEVHHATTKATDAVAHTP